MSSFIFALTIVYFGMLDIKKLRENPDAYKAQVAKRWPDVTLPIEDILSLDDARRALTQEVEKLAAERNQKSKVKPDADTIAAMKELGGQIQKREAELKAVEQRLADELAGLPNIVADDVVAGDKENNAVVYTYGKQPVFNFEPKDHVSLATTLGLIDYERAAKMSGTGFWVYRGAGALLEWSLLNYFVDFHRTHGYTFIMPPYLLSEDSAYASGHLPKFRDDLFWTQDALCLNATSEMMLLNYHRDEILDAAQLPLKYFGYSTCFRREGGGYRKEERGMIRGHQFNKIEMFQFTRPSDSWQALDELVSHAQQLVEGLGLHFQTTKLAAGDISSAMAKTFDIEVWIPSMGIYKEVSSASNALDYQARRAQIRFKNRDTGSNEFVHTLNASGLATSRLLPAILEQFQQADGSVTVPKVLQKYCGLEVIKPVIN